MFNLYKVTKTDERLVADYILPGVGADQVQVKVQANRYEDFEGRKKGHTFTVRVDAVERGKFGVFNSLNTASLKDTQEVPFEFDVASLSWNINNGVLRVSVPRKAEFAGALKPISADDGIFGEVPADASVVVKA